MSFLCRRGGWALALQLAGYADFRSLWTGSAPCQPFSSAGARARQSDERHLWPYLARLLDERRPAIFFGEQVYEAIAYGWLDDTFRDLEASQYACAAAVLPAYSAGANFEGNRLYFCASAIGQRLSGSRACGQSFNTAQNAFREATPFISALQRGALPFMCTRHNGISVKMAHISNKVAGNAVVPQITAAFIAASMEAIITCVNL